jgi:hypothetical protein
MRLNEFEDTIKTWDMPGTGPDLVTDEILHYIATHCSSFLKVAKPLRRLLYRGLNDHDQDVFIGQTKEGRRPFNSTRHEQAEFDDAISKLGFKALRSNSIFCSTNLYFAATYGRAYIIFPIDGFDFTWSPMVSDFYIHNIGVNDWDAYVADHHYQDYELDKALVSTNEILIHGKFMAIHNRFNMQLKTVFFS